MEKNELLSSRLFLQRLVTFISRHGKGCDRDKIFPRLSCEKSTSPISFLFFPITCKSNRCSRCIRPLRVEASKLDEDDDVHERIISIPICFFTNLTLMYRKLGSVNFSYLPESVGKWIKTLKSYL